MGIVLNVDDDEGADLSSDSVTNVETELAPVITGDVPALSDLIL